MRASQSGVVVMQNAAAATGNGTVLPMDGAKAAAFQVTGTFTATITFEATVNGVDWVTYALSDISTTTRTHQTTQNSASIYVADDAAGLAAIRARISAHTSGTVTVMGIATA